jgi:hypothetical protein
MNDRIHIATRLQWVFVVLVALSVLLMLRSVQGIGDRLTHGTSQANHTLSQGVAGSITKAAIGEDDSKRFSDYARAIDWQASLRAMRDARRAPTTAERSCIQRWDPDTIANEQYDPIPAAGREHVLVAMRATSEIRYGADASCVVVMRYLAPFQKPSSALSLDLDAYQQAPRNYHIAWALDDDGWQRSYLPVDTSGWFAPNATLESDGSLVEVAQ